MLKKLATSIITAALATSVAFAQPLTKPDVGLVDKIIELCIIDLEHYSKGDKTWIERQIIKLSQQDQKMIMNVCYAWGQGFLLGVKKGVSTNV